MGTVNPVWRFDKRGGSKAMPRYHFHTSRGEVPSRGGNEGIELPDKDAAWVEATAACGEIIRDLDGELKPGDSWSMVVKDDRGTEVFHLEFRTRALG
jgi:hypothetical protein